MDANSIFLYLLEQGYRVVASANINDESGDGYYRNIINYTGNGILIGSAYGSGYGNDYPFRYVIDGHELYATGDMDPFKTLNQKPANDSYNIAIPFRESIRVDVISKKDTLFDRVQAARMSCCIYSK